MSTKIYNAYKYKPNDFDSLMRFLRELRKQHISLKAEQISRYDWPQNDYGKKLYDSIREATYGLETSPFSVSASAVVYFVDSQIYVQFFGLDRIQLREISESELFIDWHYQNQTDEPENISAEEWEERERFWGRVFAEIDIPSHVGLVFEFGDCYQIFTEVQKFQKSRLANSC